MSDFHIPVLLNEVMDYLKVKPDSWYLDCNLGGGGHAGEILKRGGKVIGIDWDADAIKEVSGKFSSYIQTGQLVVVRDNFVHCGQIVDEKIDQKVDGVLFDLGVSSHQFDEVSRGFSFQADALLDMRMDRELSVRAMDLINGLNEGELSDLFWKLGGEKFSKRIARAIVERRKVSPIETTTQLAGLIRLKVPHRGKIHPATQVFQALRIAVNDELNNLKDALPAVLEVLNKGGRLVVISFHSLEDRIVKNFFKEMEEAKGLRQLMEKPITPEEDEVMRNPRSRSAKLRVAEKI